MKIIAHTKNKQELYKSINSKINNDELKTWEIKEDSEGNFLYNHSPLQWTDKVLLKPTGHQNGLQFDVKWWKNNQEPDEATKGYIIGRFTEILMVHFRNLFELIEIK